MEKHRIAIASLAALLIGSAGCVYPVYPSERPPPYGNRYHHAHDDVDLVWDASLGVYLALGFPSVYFWGGHYYRYHNRAWQRGVGPRGYWETYHGHIPPGLAKKHRSKHKKHKPGRGRW